MFSQTVEYALRAMVHIAEHPGSPETTQQIAAHTQVPPAYLAKVLRQLAAANLLQGQRGLGGGFTLHRDPQTISLLEIVNAVEPICRIVSCPLQREEHENTLCPFHQKMDGILAQIEEELGITNLGKVLESGENRELVGTFLRKQPSQEVSPASDPAKPLGEQGGQAESSGALPPLGG